MTEQQILRKKRLKKARRTFLISRGCIITGVAFILIFLVYQCVTFPWKMQFVQWGLLERIDDPAQMPDPTPLKVFQNIKEREPSESDVLPGDAGLFGSRPNVALTSLGAIKIPRIGLSENVVEGSENELYYAVGHIQSTALPGESGNCVLAGHRNYILMRPFRYLDNLEVSDIVYIEAGDYRHEYEVFSIFEVLPEDVWVTQPQEGEEYMLTLITCTPVISTTHRLIVWCRLVSSEQL